MKVLVVDDWPTMRPIVGQMLKKYVTKPFAPETIKEKIDHVLVKQ